MIPAGPPMNVGPMQTENEESRIDRDYITSIRGILKFACLVNAFFFLFVEICSVFFVDFFLHRFRLSRFNGSMQW